MLSELRLAFRQLAKSPGFTTAAILILAVGIGSSVVVFSAVKGILLRPLPFPNADQIVWIYLQQPARGIAGERLSAADVADIRERSHAFSAVASLNAWSLTLETAGRPQRLHGLAVDPALFDVLGVEPAAGRRLLPSDAARNENVVVISHELWVDQFAGSSNAIGATLRLSDGEARTIVGVLPPGLEFPLARSPQVGNGSEFIAGRQDFWILTPPPEANASRAERFATVIGRLRPAMSLPAATADLRALGQALAAEFPATNAGWEFTAVELRQQILGGTGAALKILLGAVAFVFLLACANVATLLLCRGLARQPELALRAALGAGRARILQQLLAESFVLALLGAVGGVLVAFWLLQAVITTGAGSVPFLAQLRIDGPLLALAVVLALAAGLLAGIAPGWLFSQTNPQDALKARSTGGTDALRSVAWRHALVIGQVGLTVVLLCGAALSLRSFARLAGVDLGFSPARVLTSELNRIATPQSDSRAALFRRLEQLPWVEAAGAVHSLPLTGKWSIRERFGLEGTAGGSDEDRHAALSFVGFGYFRAMGIPLLRGRTFTTEESLDLENAPVAIVSESFARRYFPGEDALEKVIFAPGTRARRIVGIVKDTRDARPEIAPEPQLYLPLVLGDMKLVVRTRATGPSAGWSAALRSEIEAAAPRGLIGAVTPMEDIVAGTRGERKFALLLLTGFAGVALLLGAVGLYAVLAYSVVQRRRELGIRMALGAQAWHVTMMIVAQGGAMIWRGAALGLGAALVLLPVLEDQLFELSATDGVSYACATLVLGAAALVACWLPARRAAKLDPIVALRAE
ncbi:MAG TPA: ABC transporter permease [Opitutus sp.]|nr:ABC transporter permease [Opitutus sp.]